MHQYLIIMVIIGVIIGFYIRVRRYGSLFHGTRVVGYVLGYIRVLISVRVGLVLPKFC